MKTKTTIISVELYLDALGNVRDSIIINPAYNMNDVSKALTKQIVALGNDARDKESRSKTLMSIRNIVDRY